MRCQHQAQRFGIVLGAGVSKSLGFPDWNELIERIATSAEVDAADLLKSPKKTDPQTSRTQMLFQRFKSRRYAEEKPDKHHTPELDLLIRKQWREIVHRCLYQGSTGGGDVAKHHPYLGSYADVIRRSPLTVNYNFDDTIERLLHQTKREIDRSRGFETIWSPATQIRTTQPVVYHPNGYLPENLLEDPSEHLVFAEDSFADQLIDSMAGHYSSLLHHLFRNTCLFVGLSLDDSTLKHLLRQNARINPGHYHYYVAYVAPGETSNPERRRAIAAANFDVYNLITLFLTSDEVRTLGDLLSADAVQLRHFADECGVRLKYCYYVCGAVGAGKTTTLSFFRSLLSFDEWLEQRLPEMAKAHTDLTDGERIRINSWTAAQFGLKNLNLLDQAEGLSIVDRSPLDPIAFTPADKWSERATELKDAISPGHSNRSIQRGQVVFLDCNPHDLVVRNSSRHRAGNQEYLEEQQQCLRTIYDACAMTRVDTRGLSVGQVVKRVASIIHQEEYADCDLQGTLMNVESGILRSPVAK